MILLLHYHQIMENFSSVENVDKYYIYETYYSDLFKTTGKFNKCNVLYDHRAPKCNTACVLQVYFPSFVTKNIFKISDRQ